MADDDDVNVSLFLTAAGVSECVEQLEGGLLCRWRRVATVCRALEATYPMVTV